jgi:hypothetical protein
VTGCFQSYFYILGFLGTGFKNLVQNLKSVTTVLEGKNFNNAYSGAAEPPVRRGVSHVSGPDGATLWELK